MSGINDIDVQTFIECVVFAKKLEIVTMDHCTQFSMYKFVKMFSKLNHINKILLVGCEKLNFAHAYLIVSSGNV